MMPSLPLEKIIADTKKNIERLEKANERIKVWAEKFEGWKINVLTKGKMQARPTIEVIFEKMKRYCILVISQQRIHLNF